MEPALDLVLPSHVAFGWGRRLELPEHLRALSGRALFVLGSRTLETRGVVEDLRDRLRASGLESEIVARATGEPTVAQVDDAVCSLRQRGVRPGDVVVALGGGAALDLGKAIAALALDPRGASVVDFLEGVGQGLALVRPPLPLIAMPTTGGTGSEATRNAVIGVADPPVKRSLRSPLLVPRRVLIDPELATMLLPHTTAWSGMDAITQLIESIVARRSRPPLQALGLQALEGIAPALRAAYRDPAARPPREKLAEAAFISGITLAHCGLGLAHGVAAPLGSVCGVPHGLACAVLLPLAMRFNQPARPEEFARIGEALTGRRWPTPAAAADAALAVVQELASELAIPRTLAALGVRAEHLSALVAGARGNSMSANPRAITDAELRALLEEHLGDDEEAPFAEAATPAGS